MQIGIICNAEDSDIRAVDLVKRMYDCLNMRIIFMRAAHHEVHTAYVSHISHITSFALALTVLEKENKACIAGFDEEGVRKLIGQANKIKRIIR